MIAKTFSIKPKDVERTWHLIDAAEAPVGRVASAAAVLLMGKHKASYTAHIDSGDGVVIINSDKLRLTGDKFNQKRYYRHSGYPGSLKEATAKELMAKDSTQIIRFAVRGMLPKNKLQDPRLARLRIFKSDTHTMDAQKPKVYEVKHG